MHKTLLIFALIGLTGTATARMDVEVMARICNNCHGLGGVSAGSPMPSIGGLPREYLRTVMKQWKYGERSSITMDRILKGFSDDDIDALATYFAKRPWVPVTQPTSPEMLAKGKAAIAEYCEDCHGLTGGDPDVGVPKINGQWAKYMELELLKYRHKEFRMPHRKMKKAAQEMKPADVSAAAQYFGAQGK